MWREIIIILLGLWLLVFAFLDLGSDSADVALTFYTGLVVLALGLWGLGNIQRLARKQREKKAGVRIDLKAEPETSGVEIEDESRRDFRGFTREKDPADLSR